MVVKMYQEMMKEIEKDIIKGNRQLIYLAILGWIFLLGVPYLVALAMI
jgi:hypothetical protein